MPDATGEAPLTENEREIALVVAEREGGETRKWLNLVLGAYDALQARLTACEAERDKERELRETIEDGNWPYEWQVATAEREKRKAAEARLSTTQEALRQIAHFTFDVMDTPEHDVAAMKEIARAALAGFAATQETP